MLKTPKDYNYDKLIDSLGRVDYKIAPNDAIQYRVVTNDGFKLLDLSTSGANIIRTDLDVTVESDGNIKLPLIGRVLVGGLTIKEAEKILEEKYTQFYVKPFVTLKISNRRVIVFPGNTGQARVVNMLNNNTTVMEAIASANGIPDDGKAYKIKLIRANADQSKKPYVYLMDLSRIENVTLGYTRVQANDIIYVEPRYRPFKTIVTELSPVLTLLTTLLILYQFYRVR